MRRSRLYVFIVPFFYRKIALVIILTRAGLDLDPTALKKIKSHLAEDRPDTVDSGSSGDCRVDEISLGFALDVGLSPRKRRSSRLASRRGALSLQVT